MRNRKERQKTVDLYGFKKAIIKSVDGKSRVARINLVESTFKREGYTCLESDWSFPFFLFFHRCTGTWTEHPRRWMAWWDIFNGRLRRDGDNRRLLGNRLWDDLWRLRGRRRRATGLDCILRGNLLWCFSS
jgi:hypothetical protein